MHGIRLRKIPVLKSTVVVIKKGQTREKSALIELRLVLKCFFFQSPYSLENQLATNRKLPWLFVLSGCKKCNERWDLELEKKIYHGQPW